MHNRAAHQHDGLRDSNVRLGPAIAYVRGKNGVVHRVR
jgi:hypothetical protein